MPSKTISSESMRSRHDELTLVTSTGGWSFKCKLNRVVLAKSNSKSGRVFKKCKNKKGFR